jgi:predicted ATPase
VGPFFFCTCRVRPNGWHSPRAAGPVGGLGSARSPRVGRAGNSARFRWPPGQARRFRPDGSNLPWVIEHLRSTNIDRFKDWLRHVRTGLPDLENVRVVEPEDDKHRYLVLCYENGLEVPSWMASDGTLR